MIFWIFCVLAVLSSTTHGVATTRKSTIREVEFAQFLLLRKDLGAALDVECPGVEKIQRLTVNFADLDGDGAEEAVVEATTCRMGNGGADIVEVLKIDQSRHLVSLKIDDSNFAQGMLYEGQSWTPRLEILNGRLTRWFVMYDRGAGSNPKKGFKRVIHFKWSGDRFVIEKVADLPLKKGVRECLNNKL